MEVNWDTGLKPGETQRQNAPAHPTGLMMCMHPKNRFIMGQMIAKKKGKALMTERKISFLGSSPNRVL